MFAHFVSKQQYIMNIKLPLEDKINDPKCLVITFTRG